MSHETFLVRLNRLSNDGDATRVLHEVRDILRSIDQTQDTAEFDRANEMTLVLMQIRESLKLADDSRDARKIAKALIKIKKYGRRRYLEKRELASTFRSLP